MAYTKIIVVISCSVRIVSTGQYLICRQRIKGVQTILIHQTLGSNGIISGEPRRLSIVGNSPQHPDIEASKRMNEPIIYTIT